MSRARILLVDDSLADVKLLRLALTEHRQDYELQVLRSGEDALRFVNEQGKQGMQQHPCVILLDLNLPQHDGLAVLGAIKRSADLAHVSVIVLSGFASPRQQEEVANLGAVYMQKPMELSDYYELGKQVIEICNGAAATA